MSRFLFAMIVSLGFLAGTGSAQAQFGPVIWPQPAPVVWQQPAPVVWQQPAPIVWRQPAPIVWQQPAPVVFAQRPPMIGYQRTRQVYTRPRPILGGSVNRYRYAYRRVIF